MKADITKWFTGAAFWLLGTSTVAQAAAAMNHVESVKLAARPVTAGGVATDVIIGTPSRRGTRRGCSTEANDSWSTSPRQMRPWPTRRRAAVPVWSLARSRKPSLIREGAPWCASRSR